MNNKIRWGAVLRDVVIICILTVLAGFVIGFTSPPKNNLMMGLALANLILGSVGFTISGCMAKVGRWKHLFVVAIGVWIVSLINTIIAPISITAWFFGFIFIALMMAIGGGLSYLFAPTPKSRESNDMQNIKE